MIKYIKEYRFYIVLFLFLMIPVIAIDTTTRNPRDYRIYDRVIVAITEPIQALISWSLDRASEGFQNYIFLLDTRRENLTLFEENRRLLNQVASLQEMQHENSRLKNILQFQDEFKLKAVVARVIAKDVSTEFRAIRINRGESSGIQKNMAVLTHEGIVGRVLRTTSTTADVVTVLDLLSAVDAIVERSRSRGVVEGLTDNSCALKFALRTDDIQIGDRLISSGLGGIFPKGVPVGHVTQVSKKSYGIGQEVEVRPSVDFSKLEEVIVVTYQEQIEITQPKPSPSPSSSTVSSAATPTSPSHKPETPPKNP